MATENTEANRTTEADAQRRNDVFVMPLDAIGFNIYRFSPERTYTPIEFERGYKSCKIFHRRLCVFAGLTDDKETAEGVADVINLYGDTVESFYLTAKGLKHCYNKLNLRVVA